MRTLNTSPARTPRDKCPTSRRGLAAIPRRIAVDLTPQAVEQVASRVAQLLYHRDPQRQPELITAGELAHQLRVERPWIYKHRHLLGGQRIGDGPKAPWRFELETAKQALKRNTTPQDTDAGSRAREPIKQGGRT
ncbi:MAG TPA: hypothetical protein VID48_04035 [Solirubrobacteraceae bacterium]|jgi:hypothetical protein